MAEKMRKTFEVMALFIVCAFPCRGDGYGMIRIMLAGDVMTGRGIDQILKAPSVPVLYEVFVSDARRYVRLAEDKNGAITAPVDDGYIWGSALEFITRMSPDLRIVNLETSITSNPTAWPEKGINYRMHPDNIGCLTSAGIDVCVLANNHVLDWAYAGLAETITSLRSAGIRTVGAGENDEEAEAPVISDIGGEARVVTFAYAHTSSGVPVTWAAGRENSGVSLVPDFSFQTVARIAESIAAVNTEGDVTIVSIHWGGNWGYDIPDSHIQFAHDLIDYAGVDVVYGHSSHHPLPFEVYRGKLILYGCGDLINDYEGIGGHERYRPELSLLYFVEIDSNDGAVMGLTMLPVRMKRFSLHAASPSESSWLVETLNREGARLGTSVEKGDGGLLRAAFSR